MKPKHSPTFPVHPDLATNFGSLPMFHCDEPREDSERILHGEAIHSGHDLVRWYRDNTAYVVSLHEGDPNARTILRAVVEGIQFVG